jgi:hypothetical protein
MKTLYQDLTPRSGSAEEPPPDEATDRVTPASDTINPRDTLEASREALLAVQRALAANWEDAHPRIAVVERNGLDTVYVSTATHLGPQVRGDIRGAVRAALAPYAKLAPYTNVIFLTRGRP